MTTPETVQIRDELDRLTARVSQLEKTARRASLKPGWYWVRWKEGGEWLPGKYEPGQENWSWLAGDGEPLFRLGRSHPKSEPFEVSARLDGPANTAVLLAALEEIADAHLGDQPAALDISPYDYAVCHIQRLRRVARQAIARTADAGGRTGSAGGA